MPNPIVVPSPINRQGNPVAGATQHVFSQDTLASLWVFTHYLGRVPNVMVIDDAGNVLSMGQSFGIKSAIADVVATSATVSIALPTPMTGKVILT